MQLQPEKRPLYFLDCVAALQSLVKPFPACSVSSGFSLTLAKTNSTRGC